MDKERAMTQDEPAVVLVHGAFAESASWNGVIQRMQAKSLQVVAAANPLRSVAAPGLIDAARRSLFDSGPWYRCRPTTMVNTPRITT
jgi:hypothetical protein